MDHQFPLVEPLPFWDQHETAPLLDEHPLGDLVESAPPTRSRLHADRVIGFNPPTARVLAGLDDATGTSGRREHASDVNGRDDHRSAETDSARWNDGPASDDQLDGRRGSPDDDGSDDRAERRRILERDRFERQVHRDRLRRERVERRAERTARPSPRGRRRAARRTGNLERRHERARDRDPGLRRLVDRRDQSVRAGSNSTLRSHDRSSNVHHDTHVAADARSLGRGVATRIHGVALVVYFALLPFVVLSKWRATPDTNHEEFVRALLVVLALFWIGFLVQVAVNVLRLRRGHRVRAGASVWLAGLVVALLAVVTPSARVTTREPTAVSAPYGGATSGRRAPSPPRPPIPLTSLGAVPMALMAKRRSDLLRQRADGADEFDVEESVALLRALDPGVIARIAQLAGDALDGILEVRDDLTASSDPAPTAPIVASALGSGPSGALVGFAREGGRLPIPPSWGSDDIVRNVVALHEGKVLFARSEDELLRALATRSLRHGVVLYLGAPDGLDDELAACAITLQPHLERTAAFGDDTFALPVDAPRSGDLRVELLRADPQVVGLSEPFVPTLRRRCVEMVAYLALHRGEPVTGERLRTRVLTHADVDASQRTLANTASAVRRSLGVDAAGSRLHPVTSSGLYVTHGLSSDVELFATLVARARALPVADAAPLAHEALLLIKGEPLASTLRGFEWFLAEGHGARLARDGEWAALALHHTSTQRRNYELAFWALQQGLLIDPYSDALAEALTRVPRLREFGGDSAGRAQNAAVGPGRAVAMSWSFAGLSQQVSQ